MPKSLCVLGCCRKFPEAPRPSRAVAVFNRSDTLMQTIVGGLLFAPWGIAHWQQGGNLLRVTSESCGSIARLVIGVDYLASLARDVANPR
jgi:hypothetical protein